jgi:FdhE protein
MNLDHMEKAVDHYEKDANGRDTARLEFFKGLFELQQTRAEELAASNGYALPPKEEAQSAFASLTPLLTKFPVAIDARQFEETCESIASYMVEHAGLEPDVAKALSGVDWHAFCDKADLALAGTDPTLFVEKSLKGIDGLGIPSDLPTKVFMMVPLFALRCHLQVPAERLMVEATPSEDTGLAERSVVCPVCGSPATLSMVGTSATIEGRSRTQFCSTCGTVWPYERIRCGVCGAKEQSKLHYFHVEGDSAHRLQSCDACGSYERVVFESDFDIQNDWFPVVPEVEDVVMAKLDRIALDPRFRSEPSGSQ